MTPTVSSASRASRTASAVAASYGTPSSAYTALAASYAPTISAASDAIPSLTVDCGVPTRKIVSP